MNKVKIKSKKELLKKQRKLLSNMVDGTSALKFNDYEKPNIKSIHVLRPNNKTFMGCWQSSYTANGGDGC